MFEEIKEMIDATVYPNGNGEVTAQNINLAMQGIVDATEEKIAEVEEMVAEIGENGVGGSGALKVWYWNEEEGIIPTEEQIAENMATYNEIVKGEPVSVVLCSEGSVDGMTIVATMPTTVSCMDLGGNKTVSLLAHQIASREIVIIMGQLDSDGSVVMLTETVDVPASSGPLTFYIGYLSTLSAEERITAEQKEHNAAMFEIYKSSPYALGVFVDQSEMFSASNGMSGRAIKASVPFQAQYFPVETGAEAIMLKQKITDNSEIGIIIFPDGSVYSANELE